MRPAWPQRDTSTKRCRSPRNQTATATATTDVVLLRSRVAADVRHKPSRDIDATLRTRHQQGCAPSLAATRHTARKDVTPCAVKLRQQQRPLTLSRSDRASLPTSVTSHRATSRWPLAHATRRADKPSCADRTRHQARKHVTTVATELPRQRRLLTLSRSDRASLPASVTSHCATSR